MQSFNVSLDAAAVLDLLLKARSHLDLATPDGEAAADYLNQLQNMVMSAEIAGSGRQLPRIATRRQ